MHARGMEVEGILPGGLKVRRRAPRLARRLRGEEPNGKTGSAERAGLGDDVGDGGE